MTRRRHGVGSLGVSGGQIGGSFGSPLITITNQPADATVTEPATASFSVTATSITAISYQWQVAVPTGQPEYVFTDISGATSSSYTTGATSTGVTPFSVYRCKLTNATETRYTSVAILAVVASPQITTQPVSVQVTAPAAATFTVVAGGTGPFTYQWKNNGTNIGGATSASYTTGATTVADDHLDEYTVVVTNAYGSITSATAVLSVIAIVAPTVTIQPSSTSVVEGSTASFSISASGTEPLSYQWYKSAVLIAGATSSSYTTPATVTGDSGATFYCVVTNSAGSATSNSATLTVTTVDPGDVTGPTVSVSTSPASPLTTDPLTLTATCSDASGIASISIKIDGTVKKTGTTSPLATTAEPFTAGSHTYEVTAIDASANANATVSSGTFTITAVPTGGGGLSLPLTLSPQATTTLGVDGGIVFPKAALTNVTDPITQNGSPVSLGNPTALRLETAQGVEVPASFRTLAVWSDATVKSVLVSAKQDGTNTNYVLRYGAGCTRSAYSTGLSVIEDTSRWTINTGSIALQLSKSAGYLFEQVSIGGTNLLSAGADIVAHDNFDGADYKSSNCLNPVYTIEEQSAVKVIIKQTGTLRSTASGGVGGTVTEVTKLAGIVNGTAQYSAISSGWTSVGTDIYANIPSWVEYSVNFGDGGTLTIDLTAINNVNTAAPGLPPGYNFNVTVTIDSVAPPAGSTLLIPGSGSAYQTGQLVVSGVASGTHTVRFTWTNDAWQSGVHDANIRLASAVFSTNSAGGTPAGSSIDYITRYTLYGGSDLIEVDCPLVDTTEEADKSSTPTYLTTGADTNMARSFSAVYFQIPYTLSGTQTYTFGTTGTGTASGTVTTEHYILQTGNDNMVGGTLLPSNLLLQRETGTVGTDLTGKWSGCGDISNASYGLTMLVNDPWQKYPHGLRIQSNVAYVDIHPQRASDKPALADPQSNRFQRPRTFYFPRHGDAYTERFLFSFHSGANRMLQLNASWQDKPRFTASSQWMCDSQAFGNLIPAGPDSAGYDDWMLKLMNHFIVNQEPLSGQTSAVTQGLNAGSGAMQLLYGKRDHGCSMFYSSPGPNPQTSDRQWRTNLNDTHIGMGRFYFTQWVRTKDDVYARSARRRARHWMDHDVSHCNRLGQVNRPSNLGKGEPHCVGHSDGQLDHHSREVDTTHVQIGGLPQYYLLYGDLRALEVLKEVGGWLTAWINTNDRYQVPFSSKYPNFSTSNGDASQAHRSWAWGAWCLLEISRVVDDASYRVALGRVGTHLQQWFRNTNLGHYQRNTLVHANSPSTGRGGWYLPERSDNSGSYSLYGSAVFWNGGGPWMGFGLVAVAIQMFEEGKDYSTILGGYTAYQWLDMILQNVESFTRHNYKPTGTDKWLYDESSSTTANEYGFTSPYGNQGSPTTFVNVYLLGGGGCYSLAWAYDKLINGDAVAGAHNNPEWFTTQAGSTKYWHLLSYNAAQELKIVRPFVYTDNVRVFDSGWYGYEPIFPMDFFTIARNIPAISGDPGGGTGTPAPNIVFSSSVGTTPVSPGTSVTLSWTVANATSLTATGGGSGGGTPTGNPVMVLGDTLISQPSTAGLFAGRLPTGSSVLGVALLNVRDAIDDYITPLTSVPATVYVVLGLYNESNNSQIAYITELIALLKTKGATTVYWQNCTAVSGNAATTDFYNDNYATANAQLSARTSIDGFTLVNYKAAFLGQTARFNGDLITHTTTGQQAQVDFIVSTLGITTSSWPGSKALPTGSEVVNPTATTSYSLTATGAGGTTGPTSVTVNVQPGGWTEIWKEDFNGGPGLAENILPSTRWGFRGFPGGTLDVDGTGNSQGGSTAWRSQNCTLDGNSHLVITMQPESYLGQQYTSGEMWTRHRVFFKYGRITFRAKWTAQTGMFPAGWMQGEAWNSGGAANQTWPGTGEFDVFEWKGDTMDVFTVLQNIIVPTGGFVTSNSSIPASGRVDEFHDYAIEWLQTGVKFYIDGELKATRLRDADFDWDFSVNSTSDGVQYTGTTYDLPFFLMLSLQGRSGQSSGTYPATLTVDWIRWEMPN